MPLPAFVGLGWLRASAEKLTDPNWRDGTTLAGFPRGQVERDAVPFPFYEAVIADVFLPHAAALGSVVLLGQLLAGLGILVGALTNAALLGGLVMNLNFLLAGAPNPSAFYVVIQLALLLANAGAVLGVDAHLARTVRSPLIAAQPASGRAGSRGRRRPLPVVAILPWRRPPTPCPASGIGARPAASRTRR